MQLSYHPILTDHNYMENCKEEVNSSEKAWTEGYGLTCQEWEERVILPVMCPLPTHSFQQEAPVRNAASLYPTRPVLS